MTADNDNEPRRVTKDGKARQEGCEASRRGSLRRNPYPRGSDEALAWISGYVEGAAKPPRSVKGE